MRPIIFFIVLLMCMYYLFVNGTNNKLVIIEPNNDRSAPIPIVDQKFVGPVSAATDRRTELITFALEQLHKPYVLGTEGPNTFDCSGFVQYVYAHSRIEVTRTTFTQLDHLNPIDPSNIQTGDLMYMQFPWDQHVGILADIDNDGQWDMIHAAAPGLGVMIDYNVMAIPFYTDALIGYRSAL